MDHDLALEGHGYRLRPVRLDDAAFVVALRGAAGAFVNRGATSVAAQREWLQRYFERADDYFFVVECRRGATPEGIAAIHDVDAARGTAEWGRFAVRKGAPAAPEAALLVYRCAFERLALEEVFCRTLVANAHVVSFHDSCGLARAPREVTVQLDGRPARAIEHRLTRLQWPRVRARLEPLAMRLAGRIGGARRA